MAAAKLANQNVDRILFTRVKDRIIENPVGVLSTGGKIVLSVKENKEVMSDLSFPLF